MERSTTSSSIAGSRPATARRSTSSTGGTARRHTASRLRITAQEALAQEVVQDAFLALWRAPEAFDPARGAFRSFFLSLVHHRAVDVVRREERLRKRTERASNLEPIRGEDVADDVVDGAYLSVRRKEVREALTILPPEQRQVIELAYFGGYTQTRIAEASASRSER